MLTVIMALSLIFVNTLDIIQCLCLTYLFPLLTVLDKTKEYNTKLTKKVIKERAWEKLEEYEVELLDMPVVQDKLVFLLHAINTDLHQDEFADEEEDQISLSASANTTDAMSSI